MFCLQSKVIQFPLFFSIKLSFYSFTCLFFINWWMVDEMRVGSASLDWKLITLYSVIKRLKIFYGGGNEEKESNPISSNKFNKLNFFSWNEKYYKSKIDWWMRKEKRKFYFSFCFVNESINCGCPFNSFFSLSSLFLMGELVKKKRVDGLGRPERIENEAKQAKSLWIGWVSGGTAARQPANEEDEPPAAADWTMKRREQPSSTTTKEQRKSNQQTRVASWAQRLFWFASLLRWVVGLNWFVCFSFGSWNEFIGGLWAAAAARQLAKKEESAERKTNEINEAKKEREQQLNSTSFPSIHESKDELIEKWNWIWWVGWFVSELPAAEREGKSN